MKGFSRSLRYFSILALEYIGLCLLVVAICFLLRLFRSGGIDGEAQVSIVLLILCFFIVTVSIGNYMIIPPIVLSCSCTRRHIFWGTQWMMLLIVSAILALAGIYCLFCTSLGVHWFLKLLPSFIGLLAGAVGLGSLLAGFVLCCGRAAAVVMSICSGLLGGVVGFCSVSLFSDSDFLSTLLVSLGDGIPYLLLGGLLILLTGSVVIRYLVLHKTAVMR